MAEGPEDRWKNRPAGLPEMPKLKDPDAPNYTRQHEIISATETAGKINLEKKGPVAAASKEQTESFIRRVKSGEVNEESIDNNLIHGIPGPLEESGADHLLQDLCNKPRELEALCDVVNLQQGPGARRLAPHEISAQHVADFLAEFSSPRKFDARFIDGRSEALEQELDANPDRAHEIRMDIATQQQRERNAPALKQALYGQKQDYWQQGRLALQQARKSNLQ